jgi:Fic family protein
MNKPFIPTIIEKYKSLNLQEVIDYEKYKLYSIVANSTALEGSTLTELDTQLLLDDGIVSAGKPLVHHLMVKDNYAALNEVLRLADLKTPITPEVLRTTNGFNMKSTGEVVNSALGTVDGTKGEFRKVQAFSDALGYYLAPTKIVKAVDDFCTDLQQQMSGNVSLEQALQLSFEAQARLILIHPWQDGNKRTSRLLSNYIQRHFDLPLGKVAKEDSLTYLTLLKEYKDSGDVTPFVNFMVVRYDEQLQAEIELYQQSVERVV